MNRILGVNQATLPLCILLAFWTSVQSALGRDSDPVSIEEVNRLMERTSKELGDLGECSASDSDLSPLALGARRVMATTYQSCGVLDLPPYRPQADPMRGVFQDEKSGKRKIVEPSVVAKSHYYLSSVPNPPPPGCRDPRVPPSIYSYGAKPSEWLYQKKGELDLFSDLSGPQFCNGSGYACGAPSARGMDCSGFVLSAMLTEGLNLSPGIEPPFVGTALFASEAKKSGSCFDQAPVVPSEKALMAGDLFIVAGIHVVIIDSVGKDPFGIQKVKSCDDVSPENFDFRILQSSPTGGNIGVNRMEGSEYFGGLQTQIDAGVGDVSAPMGFLGPLLLRARTVCRELKGQNWNSTEALTDKVKAWESSAHVFRHAGEKRPGCVKSEGKRAKLSGEECIAGCRLSIREGGV